MKILCVSDVEQPLLLNSDTPVLSDDIDVILSCGDLQPEYLDRLVNTYHKPLYFVRGNHDIRFDAAATPAGCIDAHNRIMTYQGLRILGLEGSRWYNGGPLQYTEAEMKRMVKRFRLTMWWGKGVDIVMTHAPPRHIHDAEDRCHRGFECFRWLIDKFAPRYFIHGHIHRQFNTPEERMTRAGATVVINAYGYHVLEIDTGPSDAPPSG